jgi:hypothetical protein
MKHTGERGIKKSHSNLSNNWLSTNFFLFY